LQNGVDNSSPGWYNNSRRKTLNRICGGLAQLGERLHGMQEVSGSIPLFSTKKPLHNVRAVVFFFPHVNNTPTCAGGGVVGFSLLGSSLPNLGKDQTNGL
jgi:hypothetical protein